MSSEIQVAMTDLANYIGSNDNADKMLMNLIMANGNSTAPPSKDIPYEQNLLGVKILDEFTKISKAKGDYTTFLYKTAHIPAIYFGYEDKINFVDLIRDKMSKVNKAIYTNILVKDLRYKKDCFCAKKDQTRGETYEGIMKSKLYQKEEKIVDLLS